MFVPIGGYMLETMDEFVGGLGNPIGTACYIPYHSMGEVICTIIWECLVYLWSLPLF